MRRLATVVGGLLIVGQAAPANGQENGADAAVMAVVEASLDRISEEDFEGFTDLMVDEAHAFTVYERAGVRSYRVRTREESRADSGDRDLLERGFDPTILVQGGLAVVWLPYDFYMDGEWSHCGVDAFTLLHVADGWRIAAIAWTVEQPPQCEKHPDGPPRP